MLSARINGKRNSQGFYEKTAGDLLFVTVASGAFAQGLINFFNNANTLVSTGYVPALASPIAGPVGSWYFAL